MTVDGDTHMRRPSRIGCEEDQIARLDAGPSNGFARAKLFPHFPWERHTVLREDILHKSAAVESGRVRATVSIWSPAKGQCRANDVVRAIWPDDAKGLGAGGFNPAARKRSRDGS
jgi:hypothetical protein